MTRRVLRSSLMMPSVLAFACAAVHCAGGSDAAGTIDADADAAADGAGDDGGGGATPTLTVQSCGSVRGAGDLTSLQANVPLTGATSGDALAVSGTLDVPEDLGTGAMVPTQGDGFVARFALDGLSVLEASHSGDPRPDGANAIAFGPGGDLYVAETVEATDAGVLDAGAEEDAGAGVAAWIRLRRRSADGGTVWAKALEASQGVARLLVTHLVTLADGDLVAIGTMSNPRTIVFDGVSSPGKSVWVARVSQADGAVTWLTTLGDTGRADRAPGAVLPSGELLVVANTRSSGTFDTDTLLARLSLEGGAVVFEKLHRGNAAGTRTGTAGFAIRSALASDGLAVAGGTLKGELVVGDASFDAATDTPFLAAFETDAASLAWHSSPSGIKVVGALTVIDGKLLSCSLEGECELRTIATGALLGAAKLSLGDLPSLRELHTSGTRVYALGVTRERGSMHHRRFVECFTIVPP